jgi:hypothetical protein
MHHAGATDALDWLDAGAGQTTLARWRRKGVKKGSVLGQFLIMPTIGGASLVAPLAGLADFLGADGIETGLGI